MGEQVVMDRGAWEAALREAAEAGAAAALAELEQKAAEEVERLRQLLDAADAGAKAQEAQWAERVADGPKETITAPEDMVLTYQGIRVEVPGGEAVEVPAPHAAVFRQVMEERAQLAALKAALANARYQGR